ncbi:uncharacterized protein LOC117168817 [Belonocnema kinseyi]|uniref:uncharacterized protein LOC117168817 n=1 Tax=Belonocnema kinseyi TaxID=2817044 RepID=UPI00143D44F3|nr:uncharacterized protein LOC117168817 [Belonocnema kinseyi]
MEPNTIPGELDSIPSSSSDSGLSSSLSLSCEQQLSPLLPIEEDQSEIMNSTLSSPQNAMDFDYSGSPNQSIGSVDTTFRSAANSNIGSPVPNPTEEMECRQTFLDVANTEVNEDGDTGSTKQEKQIVDVDMSAKERVQVTTPDNTIHLRNISCNGKRKIRQLIRVTPIGSRNSRSLLLPLNTTDIKEVRTIKIINAVQARNLKGFKINQGHVISKNLQVNIKQEAWKCEKGANSNNAISENNSQYQPLKLNSEEKRLLQKEGITLPTHHPLTKTEERELKRIRRKIRNKISAQDSRKRKKEYVDGLEDRVKKCTEENVTLLKRIKTLQSQNQSLAGQLKRLQALIQKGNKSAQPATCLMVFLLSLALVAVPNLRPHSNVSSNELIQEQKQQEKMPPVAGRSRSLLYTKQLMEEELQQYGEDLLQEVEGLMDHDYSPIQMPTYNKPRFDTELPLKYISSFDIVGGTLGPKTDMRTNTFRKYIEPPLDDDWPPPKPGGRSGAKILDKLETLTNELKINISDFESTRTVLFKVPQDQ